jgi:hypothetical protein
METSMAYIIYGSRGSFQEYSTWNIGYCEDPDEAELLVSKMGIDRNALSAKNDDLIKIHQAEITRIKSLNIPEEERIKKLYAAGENLRAKQNELKDSWSWESDYDHLGQILDADFSYEEIKLLKL